MTFETFFQRVRQATEIGTQKELARFLGIGAPAITLAKRRGVPKSWSLKIASIFQISPLWLETGEGPITQTQQPRARLVPQVSAKACAGDGSFEVQDNVVDEIPFQQDWIQRKGNPEKMIVLEVIGESMSPEIEDGDHILVDTSQTALTSQAVYLVGLEDTIQVKRIQCSHEVVVLLSTNRTFAPVTLQGDELDTLRVIGRVLWSSREY